MKQTIIEPHKSDPNLRVGQKELVGAWLFTGDQKITLSLNYVMVHPRRGMRFGEEGVKRPHNITVYYSEPKVRGRRVPTVKVRHDKRFMTLVDWQIIGPFVFDRRNLFGDIDIVNRTWARELHRVLDVEYRPDRWSASNTGHNDAVVEFNRRRHPFLRNPDKFVRASTTDDIRHFTQSNLGKKYTTKPIMRVLPQILMDDEVNMYTLRQLRKHFTRDEFPVAMNVYLEKDTVALPYTGVFHLFMNIMTEAYNKNASAQRKYRFLAEVIDNTHLAGETESMLHTLHRNRLTNVEVLSRAQSLQELHDMVLPDFVRYQEERQAADDARRAQRDQQYAIEMRKMDSPTDLRAYRGLEEVKIDGLIIRAPRTPNELITWGTEMQHCIGSYRRELLEGQVFLGVYDEGGKLLCNAHVRNGLFVQVLGYKNSRVPDAILTTLFRVLFHHNIVDISTYDTYTYYMR